MNIDWADFLTTPKYPSGFVNECQYLMGQSAGEPVSLAWEQIPESMKSAIDVRWGCWKDPRVGPPRPSLVIINNRMALHVVQDVGAMQ